MASDKAHLRQKLLDSRAFLDSVLDQVGDRWDVQVYSDGAAWNVLQLLRHLADSDRGQSKTAMAIARGEDPIPPDFDLERYNQRMTEKHAAMTAEQAREQMRGTREALLAWLDDVEDAALQQQGRHASLQVFSVAQYLKIMALHERTHAQDIARVLSIHA